MIPVKAHFPQILDEHIKTRYAAYCKALDKHIKELRGEMPVTIPIKGVCARCEEGFSSIYADEIYCQDCLTELEREPEAYCDPEDTDG